METVATRERIWTGNFLWTCLSNLTSFGSFYLILVGLPVYIRGIGGTESDVGLLMMLLLVARLVARPLAGAAADKWGKRVLLMTGAGTMLVATVLYQLAQGLPFLAALLLVYGLGWGVFGTALAALVADVVSPRRRGEAMGYFFIISAHSRPGEGGGTGRRHGDFADGRRHWRWRWVIPVRLRRREHRLRRDGPRFRSPQPARPGHSNCWNPWPDEGHGQLGLRMRR